MIYDWQTSLRARTYKAARIFPPATVEETGWDILLTLHSDHRCELGLRKLACLASVSDVAMNGCLATLEQRGLIIAAEHRSTGEIIAVLTRKGRELLDRYFSATSELQVGAHC